MKTKNDKIGEADDKITESKNDKSNNNRGTLLTAQYDKITTKKLQ